MSGLPSPVLLLIFLACAGAIWGAGVILSDSTDGVSDILGGNAFLPVLFLLASALSGEAVLPGAHPTDIYLTALGGLLTVVYMAGLVFRPPRQWLGMGPDSIAVLVLYGLGIAGLVLVPS